MCMIKPTTIAMTCDDRTCNYSVLMWTLRVHLVLESSSCTDAYRKFVDERAYGNHRAVIILPGLEYQGRKCLTIRDSECQVNK